MARDIKTIKKQMTDSFIADDTVIQRYGLDTSKNFEQQFSVVSLESIIFYIVSYAIWIIESLFDVHVDLVNNELLNKMPHTAHWYRDKVLRFQYPNRDLIPDTDRYDNTGLTADEIADLEVVKYCAVSDDLNELRIKTAKGSAGAREPLNDDEVQGLEYYLSEVRDAGVKTVIVNRQADRFFANIEVFYNPLLLNPADEPVETAIKEYVSNLDFNGALTTTKLVDEIQSIEGIELVNIIRALVKRADYDEEPLGVQKIAESGYWIIQDAEDLNVKYTVYNGNTNI